MKFSFHHTVRIRLRTKNKPAFGGLSQVQLPRSWPVSSRLNDIRADFVQSSENLSRPIACRQGRRHRTYSTEVTSGYSEQSPASSQYLPGRKSPADCIRITKIPPAVKRDFCWIIRSFAGIFVENDCCVDALSPSLPQRGRVPPTRAAGEGERGGTATWKRPQRRRVRNGFTARKRSRSPSSVIRLAGDRRLPPSPAGGRKGRLRIRRTWRLFFCVAAGASGRSPLRSNARIRPRLAGIGTFPAGRGKPLPYGEAAAIFSAGPPLSRRWAAPRSA